MEIFGQEDSPAEEPHQSKRSKYESGDPEAEENQEKDVFWSIEDTTFYPYGMLSHNGNKRSAIVVWSEDYMINFIFKRLIKTKQTKITKVIISLPENETIKDIFITQFNTFCVMNSGNVYCFKSMERMHPLEWLSGVRCMSISDKTFSLIRYVEKSLRLEVYEDSINLSDESSNAVRLRCFDITFDEANLFDCQWKDESYTLLSVTVDSENKEFLGLIVGDSDRLQEGHEVHFFTVSANIFALLSDSPASANDALTSDRDRSTADYSVEMLSSYASKIECFRLDNRHKICLIILECGNIEIWYYSSVARALLKQTHYTGASDYYDYDYSEQNLTFFFTDYTQIAQLQFKYCETTDTVLVLESFKAIPGIVACTWDDSVRQLVCLSCNNIFYQIDFESTASGSSAATEAIADADNNNAACEYEKYHRLYKLTSSKISKLMENAAMIKQLKEVPKRLHAEIEAEYVKQQLISVGEKSRIFSKLFEARLEYTAYYPSLENETDDLVVLTTTKRDLEFNILDGACNGFALIFLKIKKNEIFLNAHWHLHVSSDKLQNHIFGLPRSLIQKRLCITLPVERGEQELLPNYSLCCYTFISHGLESILISIPIALQLSSASFSNIFTKNKKLCNVKTNLAMLKELFSEFNAKLEDNSTNSRTKQIVEPISTTIEIPTNIDVTEMLRRISRQSASDCENSLTLYLNQSSITLHVSEGRKSLKLSSNDAGALYHLKQYLYYVAKEMSSSKDLATQTTAPVREELQERLLECQTNMEYSCNDILGRTDIAKEELSSLVSQNIQKFKDIYAKLRTEIALPIL